MTTVFSSIDTKDKELLKKTIINEKDSIWYDNFTILFEYNRLSEFFPSSDMTIEEQLNSVVRMCLYISIILMIYTTNINFLLIFLISLIFTYSIYNYSNRSLEKESFENYHSKFVSPTIDNPFMNITMDDYIKNPDREALGKANSYINTDLNHEIANKYEYNLYRDVDDIFNKNANLRQFYTMPVTTIPNRQDHFSNWLYKTPPTCKEGNGTSCLKGNYEHLKDSSIRNGIF